MAAWHEPPRRERNPWPFLFGCLLLIAAGFAVGVYSLFMEVLAKWPHL